MGNLQRSTSMKKKVIVRFLATLVFNSGIFAVLVMCTSRAYNHNHGEFMCIVSQTCPENTSL